VQDALGLGAATIDTMYTGLNGTVDVVSSIKAKLVAARTPGVDRAKIQSEITELQKQLKNTADSAVFNGENWISVDSSPSYNATKSVVSSFSRAGGVVQIDTLTIDLDAIKLYDTTLDAAYITASRCRPTDPSIRPPSVRRPPSADHGQHHFRHDLGAGDHDQRLATTQTSTRFRTSPRHQRLGIEGLTVGVAGMALQLEIQERRNDAIATDAQWWRRRRYRQRRS
jgi:flagellin